MITNHGKLKLKSIDESEFNENHIKQLSKYGYLIYENATTFDGWQCLVTLEYNRIEYFNHKKEYQKKQYKNKSYGNYKIYF